MDQSAVGRILRPVDEIEVGWILSLLALAVVLMAVIEKALPWVAARLPGRLRGYLLPLVSPLRLLVLAMAILEIAPLVIRPTAENLAILLGTGGVAIGFAFKDYVTSVIAGVVASYERPYRVGDRVEIAGAYGEVRSIGLRSLKLLTHDDTVVTIPHSRIWSDAVRNANDGLREQLCTADFFLHPDHDSDRVVQSLTDVAWSSPFLQLHRPVTVAVREEPWGTRYRIKAYPVDGRDEPAFVTDLTLRGKATLRELGARPASIPTGPRESV